MISLFPFSIHNGEMVTLMVPKRCRHCKPVRNLRVFGGGVYRVRRAIVAGDGFEEFGLCLDCVLAEAKKFEVRQVHDPYRRREQKRRK